MAEEYEEVEEVVEEEVPLSAEELFEQHKAEIDAAFEEKGFFRRLKDMTKGLSMPHNSPEYKLARTELQRLTAPILAIILPILGIVVLIVVTAVTGKQSETIQVEIQQSQEEEKLEEEKPEEEIEPETPPDENVEVTVDTPSVNNITEFVQHSPPSNEPVSVKPAEQDTVAIIKSPVTMKSMAGSRNPGVRGKYTSGGANYGDPTTEATVMKALRWLKKTQQPSGNWKGTIANTAVAVLAYLAHGETPASKEFGETVEKAVQYLIMNQVDAGPNGGVSFKGVDGNEYATLICTYALCEAFGMTKNLNAKEAAMKSLTRIVNNQSPTGGYDYKINKQSTRDDMSFEGWALQALKAGKMAGLHPEGLDECIKKAIKCLKTRNFRNGGFNYVAGGAPTGLTATGCLCMQLLGYHNEPEVSAALETMRAWLPVFESKAGLKAGGPCPGTWPQYYCYYAAQAKYQAGMREGALPADTKTWQEWNAAMKKIYPSTIITLPETIEFEGKQHKMGYWKKTGSADDTFATCLCALQLMVYYRYLPTTKIEKGTASSKPEKSSGKKPKKDDVDIEVDI